MKQSIKILTGVVLVIAFCPSSAFARFRVGLSAMGNYTTIKDNDVTLAPDGIGPGTALAVEFGSQKWGLELGGAYHSRKVKYSVTLLGVNYEVRAEAIGWHIPALIRFWPNEIFSFGLGGYYHKYTKASATFTSGSSSTSGSGDFNSSDYGLLAAMGFYIPLGKFFKLSIEGRYAQGLKKSELVMEGQGLLGIHFVTGGSSR